ncbi:MAG: DinB family protein [Pseudomonadota bacterium]
MKTLPGSESAGAAGDIAFLATEENAGFPACDTNAAMLRQAERLLAQLTQGQFTKRIPPADGTIGAHLRHVIEFYQAFFAQWRSGQVRYDLRERSLAVETQLTQAKNAVAGLQTQLPRVTANTPLKITHFDGGRSYSDTTRELSYLADHATHHFALIKLLAALEGIQIEKGFGYAPSTLAATRQSANSE